MDFLNNLISGIIGGIIVLFVQQLLEYRKSHTEEKRNQMVGKPVFKFLDKNFLYNYEPGKISIEKIFNDFGSPYKKNKGIDDNGRTLSFYKYIFENAKVEFTTYENESTILSITLFAYYDKKNPLVCLFFPSEEEEFLGKAKINDSIIENEVSFENFSSPRDSFAIIKSRNVSYPTIKHLFFCYQIQGNFDTIHNTKGQLIEQVCITQLSSICPTFSIWETFHG
jgi:hypothetical protein